jgi:hypothetical protein
MHMQAASGISMVVALFVWGTTLAAAPDASHVVGQLDTDFQAAVKVNDAQTMGRILGKRPVWAHGFSFSN